jgi:type II secretory pathway component GspD/PulD (secretin)
MVLCVILLFTPETHSQGFVGTVKMYTISGNVGLPGVTMQGLPGAPQTDQNGVYTAQVKHDWSGTVTPIKLGYTFEPKQTDYKNVKEDRTEEHYQATAVTYTISGSTGLAGVRLIGFLDDVVSDQNGRFSAIVTFGWSGAVTAVLEGYRFEPPGATFDQVKDNKSVSFKPVQVTYRISGNAGAEGVAMKGFPGSPVVTDREGNYGAEVPHNWSGTVTPTKEGHTFNPESRSYAQVVTPMTDYYSAEVHTYQISGSVGLAGVTMEGLPGSPLTDENGLYTAIVEYGWTGKATPTRPGYKFAPPSKDYAKVTSDRTTENYSAENIKVKISGNVRLPNVTLDGFPTKVVSDPSGFYTTEVEWGWAGVVTPIKEGYSFDPVNRPYSSLTSDQVNQSYTYKPLTYTISGNVGEAGVRLDGLGLPGQTVTSGQDGSYSAQVGYKWSGVVTPKKTGYTFMLDKRTYTDVAEDHTVDDYRAQINQYTVTGRVRDERGGVANVVIYADKTVSGSAMTTSDGGFELLVEHGWQGKLTPELVGYTFEPEGKTVGPVYMNSSANDFIAKVKMMSITDSVVIGTEPIQDVIITAQPGNYSVRTDVRGKFTIKVPYGWSGVLRAEKEGFDFGTEGVAYTDVTEDIDKTAPVRLPSQPVVQPSQPVAQPSQPVAQPSQPSQPVVTPAQPLTPAQIEEQGLKAQLEQLRREMELLRQGRTLPQGPGEDVTITAGPPVPTPRMAGPLVSGRYSQQDLVDVLGDLSRQANIPIGGDRTVKRGAMAVNIDLDRTPLETALTAILQEEYAFKKEGDAYLVFRPITQMFVGDDLLDTVLPEIAADAGEIIMTDENVQGRVTVNLPGVPLKTALDIVLEGTGFVAVEMPTHYLVASRTVSEPESIGIRYPIMFPEISETRAVYMNYVTPLRAKQLMSGAFERYVMADPDPNSHIVTVMAPRSLADRIVADLKAIDVRPRQVLLDARVVVMERNDLLNIGVEWGFPQIKAGAFTDSFLTGDKGAGNVASSFPYGIQVGYAADRTFTDALLMALNLLEQNGQADIVSNPQVLAVDGKQSQIRNVSEEHYVLTGPQAQNFYVQAEFVTITSGTTLTITPRIGDDNNITLEMEVEVSESVPRGQGSDLPMVTRRTSQNHAVVADGGTVALAGLTETRSKLIEKRVPGLSKLPFVGGLFRNTDSDQSTKEIAVFVTAQMVRDKYQAPAAPTTTVDQRIPNAAASEDYRRGLMESLANQGR